MLPSHEVAPPTNTNTPSRVVEATRSSPEAIRRLLETRGFLTRLLQPSHDDIATYVSMADADLAQLLSALAEKCRRADSGDGSRALLGCVLPVLRFLERVIEGRSIDRDTNEHGGYNAEDSKKGRAGRKRRRVEVDCSGWATCLAFMIAFDALADLGVLETLATPEGGKGGETKRTRSWEDDEIVRKALGVIELARKRKLPSWTRDGLAKELRDNIDRQTSVEKCFGSELQRVDEFVTYRERNHTNKHDTVTSQRENIWNGIDLDGDYDDTSSLEDTAEKCDEHIADPNGQSIEVKMPETQHRPEETLGTTDGVEVHVDVSPFDRESSDLRSTLLNSVPGATQAEIDLMAKQIVQLIQKAGTEGGAEGVARIGTVLIQGIDGAVEPPSTAQTQDDDAVESTDSPLTDELIASVSKKYINRGTSAIRASAYIRCFVLPRLLSLGGARPASKPLVSITTWLARERASETFGALLTPALCAALNNDQIGPSKALCDLINRVVKSAKEKEAIADLLSGLIVDETQERSNLPGRPSLKGRMVWTDESIPILTACINKRVPVPDETVMELSRQIQRSAAASSMSKSMKFSTFFHAFVTKHGKQLSKLSLVEGLSQSAGTLQTFMGKTITAVLKKLS